MWQIRIEQDMEWNVDEEHDPTEKRWHQVCYKYDYRADPVYGESTVCFVVSIRPLPQSFLFDDSACVGIEFMLFIASVTDAEYLLTRDGSAA